ncbi:hypothetical protein [endosymbiont GvMRE of Glomus versiforme]|uniref:hypothetical protein n=1 Tax=endosymbiont GvMRE of Glomus versiforme TaxID=2039283 RepID=UPI000ED9835E|nr:hypothetical protein [endosymbiont GvMRE of Glomus versiforme]RHZ36291.1 hypothetical protein GvMRE_Ic1g73 [endosymbiont GvMRE of Glomus versiforme]
MNKKLQRQIEKKLDKLSKLLDSIIEAQVIDSNDSDTWDSDTLYNLTENLKEALKLLQDQEIKGKSDEFGQPLHEEGLCSLMDDWESQEEEDYD